MKTQETKTTKKASSKKANKPAARLAKAKQSPRIPKAKAARPDSKKEIVLALLRREHGATVAEIAKATDWQNHSIRGFVSGQLTKRMGLKVESTRNEGQRIYSILE